MAKPRPNPLLELLLRCKEHQLDAYAYRLLFSAASQGADPAVNQVAAQAFEAAKEKIKPDVDGEYLEVEQAISRGDDPLPALRRLLGLD